MKKICVFCGAATGNNEKYLTLAKKVGALIAECKLGLVYGGGKVGIMGAIADATLSAGADVFGVIPKNLVSQEVAHFNVTKLHIVEDMHERKKMMYDLSDVFLVLPGGMGTLDEFFEIMTWAQLKLHSKPIYVLNEFSFFDSLINYLNHAHEEGFIKKEHLELFKVIDKAQDILNIQF